MINIFPDRKFNPWFFGGVLLVCFFVSAGVRYQQFVTWEKTPAAYFVGERPMMTTLDAPYWLRMAREYNEGIFGQKEGLRSYPGNSDNNKKISEKSFNLPFKYKDPLPISKSIPSSASVTQGISYQDVPLLSYVIAHLAPFFNYNYYLTGTMLIPIFASLFILIIGIYFFQIGLPASGLLGGLIGTFAGGYYMRSSIGRIDTDMLNLFFPLLTSLMILLTSRAKTERAVLLYSMGAGMSLFLFQWWYNRGGFVLVYFVVLVFTLFIHQIRFRTTILSVLLFIFFTHPGIFMTGSGSLEGFLNNYFTINEVQFEEWEREGKEKVFSNNSGTPATFPNTMTTISEVDKLSVEEVLRRILSKGLFAWGGFIAFCGLALLRWKDLLPLVPLFALGLLSFQSSNRFIMYLAPFIGIGLGWIVSILIEGLFYFLSKKNVEAKRVREANIEVSSKESKGKHFQKLKISDFKRIDWWNWTRQVVIYLGVGAFFWLVSGQTAISFVPAPSIHPRLYSTFLEVKKLIPKDSVLLTWWDYGYAITDATGLATFHDGGSQTSPKTYFVARGLVSSDPNELHEITQYLATEGNLGIDKNNTSPEALMQAVRKPQKKPWDPIYLFFTADMTGKYGAISKLGSWDISNGGSRPKVYQRLACNKISNDKIDCRGAKIDLKTGKINNQVALRRLVFIVNGHVMREQQYRHERGLTLQVLVVGRQIVEVMLIEELVFSSNYNQMFLLGRYKEDLFEESYNAFPFSRLYRVKF